MKNIFFLIVALIFCISTIAQNRDRIKVLLLGVFHFENPGLDVAKFKNADILSSQRQKEVIQVVKKLKYFAPDKIFIEADPADQLNIDSSLTQYKKGKSALTANEIQQIGFRLAKDLNLSTLRGVDYREANFPFDSLMKSIAEAGQTSIQSFIKRTIDSIQSAFNERIQKSTLSEVLIWQNSPESDFAGVEFYFRLLAAGNKNNHVGSYLTSEWWRRNMVIYENVVKNLDGKEKKILILFGSSHVALLNAMMKYNNNFELVDLKSVLN